MTAAELTPEVSMFSGEVHPFAARFPMLPDAELAELADSIKARGLIHPILLDENGILLDGRNRLAACEMAGVRPIFDTIESPADVLDLILDLNETRRHMTATQRNAARAVVLHAQGKRVIGSNGQPRWAHGSWREMLDSNISPNRRLTAELGRVVDHDPALLYDIIDGASLDSILKLIDDRNAARKAAAEAEAERRERIDKLARHGYTERISNGDLTEDEAWTLLEQQQAKAAKEQAQHQIWVKKLRDTLIESVLGIDTCAHPNNWAHLAEGLAIYPPDDRHAMTPARIRATAARLLTIAERIEAQA